MKYVGTRKGSWGPVPAHPLVLVWRQTQAAALRLGCEILFWRVLKNPLSPYMKQSWMARGFVPGSLWGRLSLTSITFIFHRPVVCWIIQGSFFYVFKPKHLLGYGFLLQEILDRYRKLGDTKKYIGGSHVYTCWLEVIDVLHNAASPFLCVIQVQSTFWV